MYKFNPAITGVALLIGGFVFFLIAAFISKSGVATPLLTAALIACLFGFSFIVGSEQEAQP